MTHSEVSVPGTRLYVRVYPPGEESPATPLRPAEVDPRKKISSELLWVEPDRNG